MARFRLSAAGVALACAVLLSAATSATQRPLAVDAFAGFDAFVEQLMAEWKIPGMAVGVIHDGAVVLAKGYGFRDVERQLPVTDKTLMAIGSNTKSFTVTLLGMLSDEGALDWDAPVRNYLPDFTLHDEIAARLMTPVDLVTHRSGLPRHDRMWYGATMSRQEIYERLRHLEPSATFRQRYQYNNLMFMTAGVLAEKLGKASWEAQVARRIFAPLGMIRSNTSVHDLPASADYSLPYMERGGRVTAVPFRNVDAVGPAGSINSNVEEMLRYVQMHIDQGRAGGTEVISRRFAARMQTQHSAPAVAIDLDAPVYTEVTAGGYGLGVNVGGYRGRKVVSHGGGIDGFISAMSWMPHDRIGVVVLSNLSGVNPVPPLVVWNVYDRLLGLEAIDHAARARAAQERSQRQGAERTKQLLSERIAGTSPSRPLAQFAGTYEHPAYGAVTIAEKNGGLALTYRDETVAFDHFHFDVFIDAPTPDTREWTPRQRITFNGSASGRIDSVAIPFEPAIPPIVFIRRPPPGKT
jgi:CubicO group peptidase (beta-lactamase class C family)